MDATVKAIFNDFLVDLIYYHRNLYAVLGVTLLTHRGGCGAVMTAASIASAHLLAATAMMTVHIRLIQ